MPEPKDEETPVKDVGGELESERLKGEGKGVVSGAAKNKDRQAGDKQRARDALPNKPQDFEVRVKIWEGRQLQGGNIHPLCKIAVSSQTKTTRVKHSTNNPYWEEIFFFNFNSSPTELFDDKISIEIFNSKKFRSDALIGNFIFDIGMVYDSPQHALLGKWVLLTSQDEASAGVKGYVKISAAVVGSGDEVPSFKKDDQSENDDIESNLLRPAGVTLRKSTFSVKLYRGEDMPQMDQNLFDGITTSLGVRKESKDKVDPFFVFQFAGKKIKSKVVESSYDPEFNQILKLGIRFPSMCEKVKFTLKDWDMTSSDDIIATFSLDLSSISSPGEDEGFLPTFGPCFINFYGSPREFTNFDQFEDLNMGKGEGVAYRGRTLLAIETQIGEYPEKDLEDLEPAAILPIEKFIRRHRFRLYVGFLEATMISAVDEPIEFEVSIGNYGNKFDPEEITPDPSYTQAANAVFDGCNYYYLRWRDSKPCVVVNSQWEDVSFRLNALNVLLKIIDNLERGIHCIEEAIKASASIEEVAHKIISLLEYLVKACGGSIDKSPSNYPLPELDPTLPNINITSLDKRKREKVDRELQRIVKEAIILRKNEQCHQEALTQIEGFLQSLKEMAIEPQNSLPDVVIWMISGDKRLAYYRIPAYKVLYHKNESYCGQLCGKVHSIFLKFPNIKYENALGAKKLPAMLRIKVWLGSEKDEEDWQKEHDQLKGSSMSIFEEKDAEITIEAEIFENQVCVLGRWTTKGMPRPKYTDETGEIELGKEKFKPPKGWRFDGDWFINPEPSLVNETDLGHKSFVQDLFEMQTRDAGTDWDSAKVTHSNVAGEPSQPRDKLECPLGWEWVEEDWQLDKNRAVDDQGWEYSVDPTKSGWGPVARSYHRCRRRRWVRGRTLKIDPSEHNTDKERIAEGWQYAPLFNMKFHLVERTMDLVRKRRWCRKMVPVCEDLSLSVASTIIPTNEKKNDQDIKKTKKGKETNKPSFSPRIFLSFKKSHKYQLRAYMYQARGLIASDSDSFSDPYAFVSFLTKSGKTEMIRHTLCPIWDQTLIFDDLEIYGEPDYLKENPPDVVIEVYDYDTLGGHEFLGRVLAMPLVKTDCNDYRVAKLEWYPLQKGNEDAGELLASFEIYLKEENDIPFVPPMRGEVYQVPSGIRPVMQRTAIEVLCWGVRNMKRFQLASVTSPNVEFEIGGHVLESKTIKNTRVCPNFTEPLLFFDEMLPKEPLYIPPMNLKVRDNRAFGRKPIVGVKVIKTLNKYWQETPTISEAQPEGIDDIDDEDDEGGEGEEKDGSFTGEENLRNSIKSNRSGVAGMGNGEISRRESVVEGLGKRRSISSSSRIASSRSGSARGSSIGGRSARNSAGEVSIKIDESRLGEQRSSIRSSRRSQASIRSGEGETTGSVKSISRSSKSGGSDRMASARGSVNSLSHRSISGSKASLNSGTSQSKPNAVDEEVVNDETRKSSKQSDKKDVSSFGEKKLRSSKRKRSKGGDQENFEEIDWWTKLYASEANSPKGSEYLEKGYDTILILDHELEKEFEDNFNDFSDTFTLNRGKSKGEDEEDPTVGEVKATFVLYQLDPDPDVPLPPKVMQHLPSPDPEKCIVRVYVVRGVELKPQDPSGLSDPYLRVKLGKTKISDKDNYIANTLDPVFGRMFELKTNIPIHKDLTITVMDYDLLSSDDIIGETVIDLENRILTKHRATCGLPATYNTSGPNNWRDIQTPKQILENYAQVNNYALPVYNRANQLTFRGVVYHLAKFEINHMHNEHQGPPDQRLALYVLRKQPLVKEHIETRPIYSPAIPGIDQGKLQLWIDIFPESLGVPGPPIDISPRKAKLYWLKIIIWNASDVKLDEVSIMGEAMSDIYVKGWLAGIEKKQSTDIHYRSLDGDGNFNWRFVFPFHYIPAEECMVVKKKDHFWSLDEREERMPPNLMLQIWDNDFFSADDFLGQLQFNLNRMPGPKKKAKSCSLEQKPKDMINLFEQKRSRGWWTCVSEEEEEREITGKLELELEILTEEEFAERPSGPAREEPNTHPVLDPPNRPATSFFWFTSPWKTLKYIIWRNYKWYIIGFLVFLVLGAFIALLIYTLPEAINKAIVG